jgi:hypothetical protein
MRAFLQVIVHARMFTGLLCCECTCTATHLLHVTAVMAACQ